MIRRYIALCLLACLLPVLIYTVLHMKNFSRNLSYEITGPINYKQAEAFKKFITKTRKGDNVTIHIESHGGLEISMSKMLYYLRKSEANVYCYVDSHASSGAANILMNCDKIFVAPRALIMFHITQMCLEMNKNGQCTKMRPSNPVQEPITFYHSIDDLQGIKPYLTKQEWTAIIEGTNLEIYGSVLMKRIKELRK